MLFPKIKTILLNQRKYVLLIFILSVFTGFLTSGLFDLIVIIMIFLWFIIIKIYQVTPQTSLIIAFSFFILAVLFSIISGIYNLDKLAEKTISYFFVLFVIFLLQSIFKLQKK